MKKILITGANSYIGTSFECYMKQFGNEYQIDTIDMQDPSWSEKDFAGYDVVFHVAGIAHQKETKENKELYYKINRDLAIDVAKKAKAQGVTQLIFLSSMSVYGMVVGKIDKDTVPNPNTNYGKSKLEAEKGLLELENDSFKVAILRPPMIYGKGCKGNYRALAKLSLKLPIFPKVKNQRSMLYIDNLSCFVKLLVDRQSRGLFFPQNKEYVNTSEMATFICQAKGKKTHLTRLLNWTFPILSLGTSAIKKAFGSLTYDMSLSEDREEYSLCTFEESILRTEE
ncbi:MAG: NAD-dependent epimerase/dehydratase family protein [Clostridia bacterium]|nr:NAD-dependent epimerase/dehydratase family protein [Clostridia bacterium]